SLVQIQALPARGDVPHSAPEMVAAGQEFRARRRADRRYEEPVEESAVARQRVDGGRREIRVAVDAQVAPALIVGQEDDDVRAPVPDGTFSSAGGGGSGDEHQQGAGD